MSAFFNVLHGNHAFLLVAQLIVVAVLLLLFLYLLAKRSASYALHAPQEEEEKPVVQPTSEVTQAPSEGLNPEEAQELARLREMHAEGGSDTEELQNKINFLESKLLEYEILQEEISTLSNLRAENEKLTSRIKDLESSSPPDSPPAVSAEAKEDTVSMPASGDGARDELEEEEAQALEPEPLQAESEEDQAQVASLAHEAQESGEVEDEGAPLSHKEPPAEVRDSKKEAALSDEEILKMVGDSSTPQEPADAGASLEASADVVDTQPTQQIEQEMDTLEAELMALLDGETQGQSQVEEPQASDPPQTAASTVQEETIEEKTLESGPIEDIDSLLDEIDKLAEKSDLS